MSNYGLYVKMNGHWQWIASVSAESHADAFRLAMTKLKPEHYSKQIRLEQESPPPQLGLPEVLDGRKSAPSDTKL